MSVSREAKVIAFAFVASAFLANFSRAELHWAGWLGGGSRTGWVADFEPPVAWPETLTKVWQVEVGTGYGSPLFADGRVYQHARQNDEEVVWCVDLETGKKVWRVSESVPFKMGGGGEWHGKGPKSSPALDSGRLFTLSITGVLTARSAESGNKLWQKDYSEKFKGGHPYWGASASPLADGDRVFVHLGNDDRGTLYAFNAETGEEVWSQGGDGASYSSPLLADIDGQRQVIEWNHEALVGIDYITGDLLWEFSFPHVSHNQNMPTPTVHNGIVLLGGENRGVLGLKPRKSPDGKNTWDVEKLWHQEKIALDMSSAVMNGELLYGFSHYRQGQFFCLDIQTGDVRWLSPGRTGANVAFLSIPGQVVALLDSGQLQIIKASGEEFNKVASYKVSDQPTWAPPVLIQDGLLIKDQETLTRWKIASP